MYDILIIGGGLAGLTNAIQLSAAGLEVLVVEKNEYPFHKVCGEYISNEVKPFLKSIGADVEALAPADIRKLMVTSPYGTKLEAPLDLGGFGISRYSLDHYLYQIALTKGVKFSLKTQVSEVSFAENKFQVTLSNGKFENSNLVIGAFGKRSNLDRQLNRAFFYKRSPYIGVKYHIRTDFPKDLIALHNFKDGYCGISSIEEDKYCFCYLTSRENLKAHGQIGEMEKKILYKNPYLKEIFTNSEFLFEKPEVINEISFEKKTVVENHILMSGDTAGMIAPLCGNGMSMAIHSSKILSDLILKHYKKEAFNRTLLEQEYTRKWNDLFATRLFAGRTIQRIFGKEFMTEAVIRGLKIARPATNWLIKQTHGKIF